MIELKNISKTFNPKTANETKLFDNFSMQIHSGDYIIVTGSNGSGKSTLLNLLAGTIRPDHGQIFLGEKEITKMRDYKRSRFIARVFQNPLSGTAPRLSILENFRLASIRTKRKGFKIGTGAAFRKKVEERISVLNLGLEKKLDQPMETLSGGQRQALTVVMASMDETKLFLLDEPTAALDPATSNVVMELTGRIIKEYSLTTLLITHQITDVLKYGNRAIHLDRGKIVHDLNMKSKSELQVNDVFSWFGQ